VRRIDRRGRHCYDEANIIEKSFHPVTTTATITELKMTGGLTDTIVDTTPGHPAAVTATSVLFEAVSDPSGRR
jgi:hypothetical protein